MEVKINFFFSKIWPYDKLLSWRRHQKQVAEQILLSVRLCEGDE